MKKKMKKIINCKSKKAKREINIGIKRDKKVKKKINNRQGPVECV